MTNELLPHDQETYENSKNEFEEKLALYKSFKAEFGREPSYREVYRGIKIGGWVNNQRTALKKRILSEERTQKLLAAGFILDPHEAAWEKAFELYKTFKAEFGREPTQAERYRGFKLGDWVHSQRERYPINSSIFAERVQKLLDVGFIFSPQDTAWQEAFELYKSFKAEFGRDPSYSEIYRGATIGIWASSQKRAFRNGTIRENRKQNLLAVGFAFTPHETAWQETFELYKTFKSEFGREPKSMEIFCGSNLGKWVRSQKDAYKNGTIPEHRAQKLLEANFVFQGDSAVAK